MNHTLNQPDTTEQVVIPRSATHEDESGVRLEIVLPGVRKEDLKIKLNQADLQIEAKRANHVPENWQTRGPAAPPVLYRLNARLTRRLDGANIQASLENGILRLLIPYSEAAKPREILVN